MRDTIDMAETISHGWWLDDEKLKVFEALVRADEREALHGTIPAAQPAVPDALTASDGESVEYMVGWNDCRSLMLEMRKP
jgi:hypothetical protein